MCIPCRTGHISTMTWSGKLNLPLEEKMQLRKDYLKPTWTLEVGNRRSDIALYDPHRELESQRLELHQANQWADQAQREKISLYGELEMRNRLIQESRTIAKTFTNYEEFVAKKNIEPDNFELMNCVSKKKRGILIPEITSLLKFRIYRTR